MTVRWWRLLFGIVVIITGSLFYNDTEWCKYGFCVDISRFNTLISALVVAVGGLSIYLAINRDAVPNDTSLICPACEATYLRCELGKELTCKQCGTQLELVKGYYERHPERLNTPNNTANGD
ncbi:MAG: hypothetical protein AB7E47_12290 [Desulfovibrionaceae bacterium]